MPGGIAPMSRETVVHRFQVSLSLEAIESKVDESIEAMRWSLDNSTMTDCAKKSLGEYVDLFELVSAKANAFDEAIRYVDRSKLVKLDSEVSRMRSLIDKCIDDIRWLVVNPDSYRAI
jgi:hypothetical protein